MEKKEKEEKQVQLKWKTEKQHQFLAREGKRPTKQVFSRW